MIETYHKKITPVNLLREEKMLRFPDSFVTTLRKENQAMHQGARDADP
jgi:hypothetical protein